MKRQRLSRTRAQWLASKGEHRVNLNQMGQSEVRHFYTGCHSKQAFVSKKIALGIRRTMMKNATSEADYNSATGLDAYKCRWCGSFHLGHDKFARTSTEA